MLATRMSNQDEEEVEDELKLLEMEVNGSLAVPTENPQLTPVEETRIAKDKARNRAEEREAEQARQPILA